ncbi:hypothetical protein [Amycolatopsis sp. H20-H5]|nr:hypothetical protein [Amycolatopsis sp. H20-H5]MEC3977369.1 hypothetical protein [Amycolatopsis sp. H20-H5]
MGRQQVDARGGVTVIAGVMVARTFGFGNAWTLALRMGIPV